MRRLLSLDYVIEHSDLPWLPTEHEKIAAFEALGIERGLLPVRVYRGAARSTRRYFPVKLPVALVGRRAPRPLARAPETGPIRRDRRRRPDPEGNGPSRDDPRELGRGARRLRRRRSGPPRDRPDRAGDPRHGRRGDREAWRAAGLPREDRRAEGPAPVRAARNDDRRVHDMAFEPASRGRILTAGRRGSVACRACTSTSGCLCTASPFRCARRRFRMSLAALRLHHGRRSGDAVLEGAAVAGATPPSGCLVRHRGRRHVHAHAILRRGSLPTSDPSRKGVQRRCGAADRQFYQPSSRCVCATAEDRARTRGERQTVGCRERRAMSRRFGSPETLGCGKVPVREFRAQSLPRP